MNEELLKLIVYRYNSSGRHHHDYSHLTKMFNNMAMYFPRWCTDYSLYLGVLFHDFYYDVRRNDNELRSSDFAYGYCTAHNIPHAYEIKVLIQSTAFNPENMIDLKESGTMFNPQKRQILHDLDYSYFFEDEKTYMETSEKIIKEYSCSYDLQTIYKERVKFLKKLEEQRSIFISEEFKTYDSPFNLKAKENIKTEIEHLNSKIITTNDRSHLIP